MKTEQRDQIAKRKSEAEYRLSFQQGLRDEMRRREGREPEIRPSINKGQEREPALRLKAPIGQERRQ